jgi:3-oxoacyl-[acyl-carrier protein] reductase
MPKILITGASRGLGLVAVEAFRKEDWEVYPFTRKDYDYLKNGWNYVVPEVDAVLHCAGGGLGYRSPYLTAKAMWELFMTNLGGAMEINRIIIPLMQAKGYGRVVHVLSIASGEAIGSVGYNVAKTALSGYVRSMGREVAEYGVVVSGIAPGGFQAPDNAMDRLARNNPPAYTDFVENRLPRGVMGKASELIPIIKFLCSEQASMMGGCIVPIDAGEGHYYT